MRIDLTPATREVSRVVAAVRDEDLDRPTPCPDYSVGALLDHLMALTRAFAIGAHKGDPAALQGESAPGRANGDHLDEVWPEELPHRLGALAAAWADPSAWQGETFVGIPLPAPEAGVVALDEVVLHGWDLARAIGVDFEVADEHVDVLRRFLQRGLEPDLRPMRDGMFGPPLPYDDTTPAWERVLAMAGRDPRWAPAG